MLEILNAKHTITKNTCVSLGLSLNSEISDNEGGMIGAYSSISSPADPHGVSVYYIYKYIFAYKYIDIYIDIRYWGYDNAIVKARVVAHSPRSPPGPAVI